MAFSETGQPNLTFLNQQLELSRNAVAVLRYSYDRIPKPLPENLSDEMLVDLDALTSRFARLADIVLQKLFRAIDAIELVDEGSLIDRMNRAEKRGIIESAEKWREIRVLRNQIAHEYVLSEHRTLFESVLKNVPELFDTMESIENYVTRIAKGI